MNLRHCQDLAALCELVGEDRIIPMLSREESVQAGDRVNRRAVRRLLAALTPPATPPCVFGARTGKLHHAQEGEPLPPAPRG